jgi:amino acid adenylation domain-containing protein
MLEDARIMGDLTCLRSWTLSGEEVRPDLLMRLQRQLPTCEFIIQYGSSEVSSDAAIYKSRDFDGARVPIGRPLPNVQIYILDAHGQPVPVGAVGEIYVGGVGVGRGYLNRAELTAERFLSDGLCGDPLARLYRTGDLGRWRVDGILEYMGRDDFQVKIRGFRIELGEIEAQLLRHELVREAVVLVRQDVPDEKRLVAYVKLRTATGAPIMDVLRTWLRSVLPEYMVPVAFVVLERFPLTPNGKLDRRSLPAPGIEAYSTRKYQPPVGEAEQALGRIWRELLRVERVSREDNFFELGGHSLLIVQMMEALRRVGLSTEVRSVYASATLADLARTLRGESAAQCVVPQNLIPPGCEAITSRMLPLVELAAEQIERIVGTVPGGAVNVQDIYPLAPLQEGILFHHLLNERGGDTYVLPTLLSLSSREKLHGLIGALQAVIDRHDVLRTAVLWEHLPRPVQVVYRRATLPVEELQLDRDRDSLEQLVERMRPERLRLDLSQAPLMRLQVAADPHSHRWYALLQTHHLVCDNQSLRAMLSEVIAHVEGRSQWLPEPVAYRNHVAQALAHAQMHDAEAFFRGKLAEIDEPTAPFGLLDVHGDGSRIEEARQALDPALARRVREQARRLGVSAATLFHAAWALVVACTSGRTDVVYGTVLLGRLQGSAGAQRTLGMFINTLPLRLRLPGVTARQLVEQTQRELAELLDHEQASLAVAQQCSGIVGSAPLFSALLNYRHDAPRPEIEKPKTAQGIQTIASREWTNYPFMLSVDDQGEAFALSAQVDCRVGPQRVIGHVSTVLRSLVEALEQAEQTPALALQVLPQSEWEQVVELFNATRAAYPQQKLIHELFEEQVVRTPDAIAVVCADRQLTYDELNRKANQLARYLINEGVSPDQLVGICLERSVEMVVGLLGILKAGGAYVPLDSNYPAERLQYMLEDAAPRLVLTQEELRGVLPATQSEVIALDTKLQDISGYVEENLSVAELGLTSRNLVYVIYTSGSTGRPKGTAMAHGSMINLIEWHRENFCNGEGRRVLQFAALSFDVAFQETFTTLCTGGTLMLVQEWMRRDAQALTEFLSSRSIERLFVPPLMLQSLAECCQGTGTVPAALRDVITAGEQLRISQDVASFFQRLPGCRLHNHYGPTETHVVTALTLTGNPTDWPSFPAIGRPVSNTQIYLLDGQRQPVPMGVAGEIYIGGAGVAQGYWKRPELTAQRFVADPFSADSRARLYKTGDLGRWQADGTLEYLGRNDDQVKIRGYRIELEEIEAQLARHQLVKEAAVVAREDVPGAKRLVAYITQRQGSALDVEELRAHLKAALPEYMIPSAFVTLERLPLTPNGKLDRRALPAPELGAYGSREYAAPQGEIEEILAGIWQSLLGVERVGRDDNFFELGGHSLHVMKLNVKIADKLTVSLSVPAVFRNPTIRRMANIVESLRSINDEPLTSEGVEFEEGVL